MDITDPGLAACIDGGPMYICEYCTLSIHMQYPSSGPAYRANDCIFSTHTGPVAFLPIELMIAYLVHILVLLPSCL